MAGSNVQAEVGTVKSGVEKPAMRRIQNSYTKEIVGGRVVSWLTGRVLLIQPPPDKPSFSTRSDELEASIDRALEGEQQVKEAKKLGALGIAGTALVPDDLSSLQGTEVATRELVPAS